MSGWDDTMLDILKIIAALASAAFGLMALWQPGRVAALAFLQAETAAARAEIRASWGGLFLGLGVAVLLLNTPEAFRVFGIAYAVTAAVRLIGFALDRSTINRNTLVIAAFEIISAVIFLL